MNKTNGFTLVEMIVVLTIITVLGATTIPSMIGLIEDRKSKECEIIRDEMVKMYDVIRSDGEMDVSIKDFESFVESNWKKGKLCPTGGKYRYPVVGKEHDTGILNAAILCDIHGSNNRDGMYTNAIILQEKYFDIIGNKSLTPAQRIEEVEKLFAPYVDRKFENDIVYNEDYRSVLQAINGGGWGALDPQIREKINTPKYEGDLYVNVYVQPKGDVIIYANESNNSGSGKAQWAANAIYNPDDGSWYKVKEPLWKNPTKYKDIAILNKPEEHNWDTIKADLAINWEKVVL